MLRDHRCTFFVVLRLVAHVVDYAIDFDAELRLGAIEVDHVVFDRMLAAEFDASGAAPDFAPQQHFGQGHLAAEAAGLGIVVVAFAH